MKYNTVKAAFYAGSLLASVAAVNTALAGEIYKTDSSQIDFNLDAGVGLFNSQSSYALFREKDEAVTWQEYYLRPKFSAEFSNIAGGTVYSSLGLALTQTTGDGDAAGITSGNESAIDWDNALLGYKSELALNNNHNLTFDFSVGSQTIIVGDGFLISGDALNFGENDIIGDSLDRGGAYWMGGSARSAFANSILLTIGSDLGFKADLFKIKSDNQAQGEAELTGINLEYATDNNTFAALYFDTESKGNFAIPSRDGLTTLSVRYQGNAGVENLFLSAEWATQDNDGLSANAYYTEAGWTLNSVQYSPSLSYRFSSFEQGFDPLFYGVNRGLGTWFQGEVAANYAGPFNTNVDVHHLGVKMSIAENLSVGGLFYHFETKDKSAGENLSANELDIYAEYFINENLLLMPVVGLYNPEANAENGGTQIGSADSSIYSSLTLFFFY